MTSRFPACLTCLLLIGAEVLLGNAVSADIAIGAPQQPLETTAISFLNPSLGWRLAVGWDQVRGLHGPLYISRTINGGLTWKTIGTVPNGMVRHAGSEVFRVSSVAFASARDGWAYGAALYSTHDAGRTWTRVSIQGNKTALSIAGRSVWRLDEYCSAATCVSTIFTSEAGSDQWTRTTWQPPSSWTTGASLTRADVSHAWLLSGEMFTPPNHVTARLLSTSDGGKSWHTRPLPCATQGPIGDILAAYDSRHLWAFCASEPGAGEQLKTVNRSRDGGRHWRLVSASGQFGLKNLSVAGYVRSAALVSPSSAWLALGRGTLLHTADGGRSWREAIPYAVANPGDGGVGPVIFVDPQHGWLLSLPYLLFRTVDGGRHWQKIRLP